MVAVETHSVQLKLFIINLTIRLGGCTLAISALEGKSRRTGSSKQPLNKLSKLSQNLVNLRPPYTLSSKDRINKQKYQGELSFYSCLLNLGFILIWFGCCLFLTGEEKLLSGVRTHTHTDTHTHTYTAQELNITV